jgi:hypothetical protein
MLLELKGNMFAGKCIEESINGEEKYYDQLGSIYASEVTQQFADSPESDITHARRRVVATPYDVGIGLDKFDKVQELINPESGYVQRQVSALQRKGAIEFMNGALGDAGTGKAGTTAVSFDTDQIIPVATGDTASTGMNLEKLQATLQLFEENNLMLDDPMNKLYFAWGPQQKKELLEQEKVTSSDYAAIKALVNGQINSYYGFEFVSSNMIPYMNAGVTGAELTWGATDTPTDTATADLRACFAWAKSGVVQVTNPNLSTDVSQRKDKSNNWYSYSCLRTGAVRMEEEKVVLIPCDQSPA